MRLRQEKEAARKASAKNLWRVKYSRYKRGDKINRTAKSKQLLICTAGYVGIYACGLLHQTVLGSPKQGRSKQEFSKSIFFYIFCSSSKKIYTDDILNIVDGYDPYNNPAWRTVLNDGVPALLRYAEAQSVFVDISDCRSACGVCRKAMSAIKGKGK